MPLLNQSKFTIYYSQFTIRETMSWTDTATIKKHLMQSDVAIGTVENEEHTLWAEDEVQLHSAVITESSEAIKTIDLNQPYEEGAKILSGTGWRSLAHAEITPGSMVAADDVIRSNIYIEGTDYVVDYDEGKIRRVSGGSISDGGTVYLWYLYYTVHTKDTDYTIDYTDGSLARIAGGGIADGGIVYADYTTTASTIPDALISESITEAEDKILARLTDNYDGSSSDQGLKTGATELAISVICNAKAMDIMNRLHSNDSDNMAKQWREMSGRFARQAWETLSRFIKKPGLRAARTKINLSLHN